MTIQELRDFIALLLILSASPAVYAQQTASVNGYISDAENGETLIAANLAIKDSPKGTSTNTFGYFMLTDLTSGTYTFVASYIGYQWYEETVTLKAGENLRLNIQLRPKAYRMEEIVVRSPKEIEEQRNIGIAQIETKFIKQIPPVFEADVFRSLQLLPGVKAASDFSSGLYIRGGSPDQTLILLDQTTVYNPSHFFGFYSTFNPDAIKDVRLYKGGFPAKYGGRIGSVLTIQNKDGNRNEFEGSATLGVLASRASIEGPLGNGSYMLAIRRSTLEPALAVLQKSYDDIPNSFYFWDINSKLSYDLNTNNKLSLSSYSGKDHLAYPFADEAGIDLDYGNLTLSSDWTHIFSDKLFSNFTITVSRYFNYPSFNIASTPFERSNNIYDYSLKGDLEYLPQSNHNISFGFWMGSLTLKLTDTFNGEQSFRSRIHSEYGSVYLQDEWALSDHWITIPGLRVSAFNNGSYLRLEPRFAIEYIANNRLRFQIASGRYNQFLTLVSNEAFTGFDVWLTTNDNVAPSYGNQYVFGIKTIPFKNFRFDVELYYRSMDNLFEPNPFIPDQAGLSYPEIFRFGEGYAYGSEIYFEKVTGRLTGFVSYTYGITRRKFPDFNEPLIPGIDSRFYPPKYDRTHDLNVALDYQMSSHWSTNIVFSFASGQAFTQPVGRAAAFDFPTRSNWLDQLLVGKVNASRLPPYHRLDIGFSRIGTFLGMGEATWQIQVVNVYSRRNIWFYDYNLEKNPAEREAVTLLPVIPSLSYTINF